MQATTEKVPILDMLPAKERLIVQRLRDFVENDNEYTVALVAGIRKAGKTTALKQLQASYPDAFYVDLVQSDLVFSEMLGDFCRFLFPTTGHTRDKNVVRVND